MITKVSTATAIIARNRMARNEDEKPKINNRNSSREQRVQLPGKPSVTLFVRGIDRNDFECNCKNVICQGFLL